MLVGNEPKANPVKRVVRVGLSGTQRNRLGALIVFACNIKVGQCLKQHRLIRHLIQGFLQQDARFLQAVMLKGDLRRGEHLVDLNGLLA